MNRLRLRTLAVLVAVVALIAAADLRSQQGLAISGSVAVEENGRRTPVRRAAVTLTNETAKVSVTAYSNNEGRFAVANLAAGRYRLQAKKAGFLQLNEVVVSEAGTFAIDMQRAAALEGRFIEATGKPIPDLTVSAESISQRGTFTAKTDDLGRFRIHTLPPGQYRIFATPPLPASGEKLFYPGTEDIAQATVVTVIPGQTADGLTTVVPVAQMPAVAQEAMATQELQSLAAPQGGGAWGQISGRVTSSDSGQPIVGVEIRLTFGGVLIRKAWTNGDGGYTFTHVVPGTLSVAASADGHISLEATSGVAAGSARVSVGDGEKVKRDLVLTPLSAIEGRVIDEFSDGVPDVTVRIAQKVAPGDDPARLPFPRKSASVTTDDRGWYRASALMPGEYYLVVIPRPFAPSSPAPFPITYFPGARSSTAAAPITLSAGIDAHGVNLTLPVVRSTTMLGLAVDPAGRPQMTTVELTPVEDGPIKTSARAIGTSNELGRFTFRDVPEGTYTLRSRGLEMMDTTLVTVTADAGPETPVRILLKPLGTIRGRVTFEGGDPAERARGLTVVRLQPADITRGFACASPETGGMSSAQMLPDLTFHLRNVACPGVLRTSVTGLGSVTGWTLARVLHQGKDITDTPMDFQSGDFEGVEVVLTQRGGSVSGSVLGVESPGDVAVVIAGADSDSVTYFSRTLRITMLVTKSAEFELGKLLPGRYYVLAVRRQNMPLDPAAFAALRAMSMLVTVTEGQDVKVSLAIVK